MWARGYELSVDWTIRSSIASDSRTGRTRWCDLRHGWRVPRNGDCWTWPFVSRAMT